jgi:autotransporter-associated beta strand protein
VLNGSATPCTLTLNIENGNDQFVGTLGGGGANENNFSLLKTGPGKLWLARSLNLAGSTTVAAGTLELHTEFYMGNGASGTFNIGSNATLAVSGWIDNYTFNNVTINYQSAGSGTFTAIGNGNDYLNWYLTSGMTVQTAGGAQNVFSATPGYGLNLNGNNVLFNVVRGMDASFDLTVSAPFSSSGSVTKQGNGILRLTAANTYPGSTTIGNGTLLVNGSLANGAVTVAGGTLGGTGTIGGAVTVQTGASLAPGVSLGTLSISNVLTLAAGSQTEVDINAATGTNDLVRGLTTVNYGGTLVVSNLAGIVTNGQRFKLFSAAAWSGNFTNIIVQPPLAGLTAVFNPTNGTLVFAVPVTLVSPGAVWKYFDQTNDLGTAWRSNSFNDAAWNSGPAMLGFGDANGLLPTTVIASNRQWTTYFRRAFHVPQGGLVPSLDGRILRDDGAVVYLNGTEVWRDSNMPPGVITNATPALTGIGGTSESTWIPLNLPPSALSLLVTGMNLLAIEVHQNALTSSDLAMDFELTGTALVSTNTPLTFARGTNSLLLSWPADAGFFNLYTATTLTAVNWTRVTSEAVLSNSFWIVPLPVHTNGTRFFRLQTQ